ncbi:MAG: hypothetical protein RR382_02335 [Tannerellaceae bacterium]
MQDTLSNQIKVLLFNEDVLLKSQVERKECMTVQKFDYCSTRTLNHAGWPYGPSSAVSLHLLVRSELEGKERIFYRLLQSSEQQTFSLFFNATFNPDNTLKEYKGATIVAGYVIQIEDAFKSYAGEKEEENQMLMDIHILVSSIKYMGKNLHNTLFISQK